jgi:transposase-like protein
VSQTFISSVIDAVMDQLPIWQARPLEPLYPVAFFDALCVEIREKGRMRKGDLSDAAYPVGRLTGHSDVVDFEHRGRASSGRRCSVT